MLKTKTENNFRFGSGYALTVRAKDMRDVDTVRRLVDAYFPENIFKEAHSNQLLFQLPLVPGVVPRVFQVLQAAKADPANPLEDFSVSQMTLDDVFIQFAKQQGDNEL